MRLARGEADVAQEVPALHGSGMFFQPQARLGAVASGSEPAGSESERGAELGALGCRELLPCAPGLARDRGTGLKPVRSTPCPGQLRKSALEITDHRIPAWAGLEGP